MITPITKNPKTQFVVSFVGANTILKGTYNEKDKSIMIEDNPELVFENNDLSNKIKSGPIFVAIRPENIVLYKKNTKNVNNLSCGKIVSKMYKGAHIMYEIETDSITLRAQVHPQEHFKVSEQVYFKCTRGTILEN